MYNTEVGINIPFIYIFNSFIRMLTPLLSLHFYKYTVFCPAFVCQNRQVVQRHQPPVYANWMECVFLMERRCMGGTICVHTILHLGIKNVTFFMASGILQKMTDRYFTMFQNWGYVCGT